MQALQRAVKNGKQSRDCIFFSEKETSKTEQQCKLWNHNNPNQHCVAALQALQLHLVDGTTLAAISQLFAMYSFFDVYYNFQSAFL